MPTDINTPPQPAVKRELGEWENPTFEAIIGKLGSVASSLRLRADRFVSMVRDFGILSDQDGPEGQQLL